MRWLVACALLLCLAGAAGATGIDELTVRAAKVFWYEDSDGQSRPIASGRIVSYEAGTAVGDTAAATQLNWLLAYAASDSAYFYTDNPPTSSYDCWWTPPVASAATVEYRVAQYLWVQGRDLPDSILTGPVAASAIKNNAITASKIDGIEAYATQAWVTDQGYGAAGQARTAENITDIIWGATGATAVYGATGSSVTFAYNDSEGPAGIGVVWASLNSGAVAPWHIGNWATTGTVGFLPVATNATTIDWQSITSMFTDGDNLDWDYTTNPPTLNWVGSTSGYTQDEIEDFAAAMFTDADGHAGISFAYSDDDPGTVDATVLITDQNQIADGTLVPEDLDANQAPDQWDIVSVGPGGTEFQMYSPEGHYGSSAIYNELLDAVCVQGLNSSEQDGITVSYDAVTRDLDFDVLIDDPDTQIQANTYRLIRPNHFDTNGTPPGTWYMYPETQGAGYWAWKELGQIFAAGDYCSWASDASGTYTLNVATLPTIDPLDIDNGDIATLLTAIVHISSGLTVSGNATFDTNSILNVVGGASFTSATFDLVSVKGHATMTTASIATALSVATGGTISVCGNQWNTAAGMMNDDYVTVDGTAIKAYIDAADAVCKTQEDCIGAGDGYDMSGLDSDGATDTWFSPIEVLSTMCYSDTAYFGTFTTADPTRQYYKFWKSGATENSSVILTPSSCSTAGAWPLYDTDEIMTWHAYATATAGQVLIVPGLSGEDITNNCTVTYKVVVIPPLSAW